MNYTEIRIPEELGERVVEVLELPCRSEPRTLGDLARAFSRVRRSTPARRPDFGRADPPRGQGWWQETLHLLLLGRPGSALRALGEPVEVRSESPVGGEVTALVTEESAEVSPQEAVMSFGAARVGDGPVQETLWSYANAFPSLKEYEIWAKETPQAITVPIPVQEAFALVRDVVGGSEVSG
jgi:alkylmercury lyase